MKRSPGAVMTAGLVLVTCIVTAGVSAQDDEHGPRAHASVGAFRTTAIRYEVNETDQDAEVVINFRAHEGLERLVVLDPHRNKVVDLHSKDGGGIGLAQGTVESGEPSAAAVRAAFPEGTYTFLAHTVDGKRLAGNARLTHTLLPAPSFVPRDDHVIDANHVVVQWTQVPGAAAYVIEIEQDDLGFNLTTTVTPDVLMLALPPGILRPGGVQYQISMSTVTATGNISLAESTFVTAP